MADLGPAVSNTSPLLALYRIGRHDLLERIFRNVWIPDAVRNEIDRLHPPDRLPQDLFQSRWLEVRSIRRRSVLREFESTLHPGEAEAILLAEETQASWILLDEREARSVAMRRGLRVTGTIGILLRAKRRGWIPAVGPEMNRLRTEGRFWMSDRFVQEILDAAGESTPPR